VIGVDPLHAEGIERAIGAAVPIGHRDDVIARTQACQHLRHRGGDPLGPVVQ
jgi:hypothetical protein